MLSVFLFNGLLEIVGGNPREEGKRPLYFTQNLLGKLYYQPVARIREELFLRGIRF